jgi:hypothetical protein
MSAMIWVVRYALLPVSVICPYLRSFQQIVDHQLAVCCLLAAELSLFLLYPLRNLLPNGCPLDHCVATLVALSSIEHGSTGASLTFCYMVVL